MDPKNRPEAEAPARALALILSADGSLDERAVALLGDLGAFDALGVSRQRFIALARECGRRIAPGLGERSWLTNGDIEHTATVLDAVGRPDDRVLVCRLAVAAMDEDGLVTHGARLVLDHALAHWHIDPASLPPAKRQAGG